MPSCRSLLPPRIDATAVVVGVHRPDELSLEPQLTHL
jgi:hypothetical protein